MHQQIKLLSLLIIVSLTAILFSCSNKEDNTEVSQISVSEKAVAASSDSMNEEALREYKADKVIAYYFHGNTRCQTCLEIESISRELVLDNFILEMYDGILEWRSVNYDIPENSHFFKDFGLKHPSLVIVYTKLGQIQDHRLLEKTWDMVTEPEGLRQYVDKNIKEILGKIRPVSPDNP